MLERLSLETGETACLGLIDGDDVHYVAEVIPAIADEESWLERRVDLHAASMGKAFLAYVEPGRVREIIGDEPPRYTDATITNLEQFLAELDQVRDAGLRGVQGRDDHRLVGRRRHRSSAPWASPSPCSASGARTTVAAPTGSTRSAGSPAGRRRTSAARGHVSGRPRRSPRGWRLHPAPDLMDGSCQLAQVGRSGNPARPVASVLTASTWCSWISLVSKP